MTRKEIVITDVTFAPASKVDQATGLVSYVACTWNGIARLDCMTIRRSREGQLYVGYRAKTNAWGIQFPYLRLLDDRVRESVERQILAAYRKRRAS